MDFALYVNVPEQWGFLRNQVTPFTLRTPDGESLHAWHILPLELYQRHRKELAAEDPGLVPDVKSRLGFALLRDDPAALLVLYLHGAAGTLASGWRPASYRAMSALAPRRIHVLAIDYRGFGASSGYPSEEGLLVDAVALVRFAVDEVGIPPERIVVFAQSLGTAVAVSLIHHLAVTTLGEEGEEKEEPVLFSGVVLVAPFADVESLTATYRLGGMIPLLGPVGKFFPGVLGWLNTLVVTKWPSKDKLGGFIRWCENIDREGESESRIDLKYYVIIIHAEDDYDIPWSHSEQLFWHAVNASSPSSLSLSDGGVELKEERKGSKVVRGGEEGGWAVERQTKNGVIRMEIMRYGLHDRIMSYPVVSLAVMRAFTHD
ncbi:abhydrolase domain-containing protein 12 [Xylariaceae sp. AK1471]|nr:abhydrolase domain-containing protein 12 [Xylariaceae sp. AK1471]